MTAPVPNIITVTGSGSDTWAYRFAHHCRQDYRTRAHVIGPDEALPEKTRPGDVIIRHENRGQG